MTVLDIGECFCGQTATRLIGTVPYCAGCADTVLAPLRAKHPSNGQQTGPLRPDYGPGWAELRCTTCGYEWVGHIGEPCGRCVNRLEADRKTNLALVPPAGVHLDPGLEWKPLEVDAQPDPDPDGELRGMLIDWPAFWAHDHGDAEWLAEPLLPAKRSTALFAPGGTGKSLLALWLAAHLAEGRDPFTGRTQAPISVLYLDYEMTEADLSERLEQMGFGPDHDLVHLHYALLPSLPGLDEPEGGRAVVRLAQLCDASLVIIDTFGRAVHGDENDADTVRAWYRWTGLHLKHEGRAFLRVDHAGKDLAKGQRGTSAKNDDVDVVWQMTVRDGGFRLSAKKRRMGWVPLEVDITMSDEPLGFGLLNGETWPAGTKECADAMDALDVPLDSSNRVAARLLSQAGNGTRAVVVRAAQKYRRRQVETVDNLGINGSRNSGTQSTADYSDPLADPPPVDEAFDLFTDSGPTTGPTGTQQPRSHGVGVGPSMGPTPPDPPKPRHDELEEF